MLKPIILSALFLFCGTILAQVQDRFVMAASFSNVVTVDDSTYTADLSFQSDQTAGGYLANQIQAGWRILTSTKRQYVVTVVNSSSFTTANLTFEELPGTTLSPTGVAAVYQYDGSTELIPTLPTNSTGISTAMRTIIQNHNLEILAAGGGGGGGVTTLPADSVTVADPNAVFDATDAEAALYELYLDYLSAVASINALEQLTEEHGFKEDTLAAIGAATGYVRKYGLDDLKATILTGNATSGYTITVQTAEHAAQIDFIGNSTTTNASGELVLIINNGLDNYGYFYSAELYDLGNDQRVDEFLTGNIVEQTRAGTTTTITIPNMNNYPNGFRLQLR